MHPCHLAHKCILYWGVLCTQHLLSLDPVPTHKNFPLKCAALLYVFSCPFSWKAGKGERLRPSFLVLLSARMPGPTLHLPRAPVPFQSNPRLHMLIKLAHSPLLSSSSLRIPLVIFRRPAPTHGHLSHTQPSRPPTPHPPHVSVQARTSHLSSAHCTSPAPTPFPGTDFSLATPMFPQALVSCYAHRCPSHRLPTPPGPAGLEEAGVSSTSFPMLPPPNPPLLQRLERALPVVRWPPKDQSPSLGNQTRFI